MAVTAATKTTDFSGFIPAEIAQPIFEKASRQSVVQQLAPQVPLAYNGKSIPVYTGRPIADWVDEGAKKPATKGTMTLKTMTPKKLAAIIVVSEEVVRADPGGYVAGARDQLAEAFAVSFDLAALHDAGGDGTAGAGPFATFIDQTTKSVELGGNTVANGGVYKDLINAMDFVITTKDATGRRRRVNGFALDSITETRFRGAVDTTGQPIFVDLPTDAENSVLTSGRILGRRAFIGEGVANATDTILGYAGDWSQAAWGVVGGINYAVSNQATVTINGSLVSLWEQNLVAIRAEAEYGFLVNDVDAFVQLRNDSGS